ncbi:MAG: hypothetical protein ACO3JL_02035 [Myxococcota bacterium]
MHLPSLALLLTCQTASVDAPTTTASPAPAPDGAALVQECYKKVELTASSIPNMRAGRQTCEAALQVPSLTERQRFEAWLNIARAHLRSGDLLAGDGAVAEYELGRKAAQQAMALDPRSADAIFWDVANLASIGQTRGVMKSLFMLPEIKASLHRALELNPGHSYARQTLAKVYHKVPRIAGGDDDLAEKLLLETLTRDPGWTPAMVVLAQLYVDQDRHEEARVWIEKVIAMPSSSSSIPHDHWRFDVPDAKKLQQRVEGK